MSKLRERERERERECQNSYGVGDLVLGGGVGTLEGVVIGGATSLRLAEFNHGVYNVSNTS
jgi:hypothetical protein